MRTLAWMLVFLIVMAIGGVSAVGYVFYRYGQDLPDYKQLADYEPPTVTRMHAGDGRLLAEYAEEKRVFVPVNAMPRRVINAFISAEDKNFYSHPGIDLPSVARAALTNLANLGTDRRPVGASTITQQVAKNFLLSDAVSIERKIREAILAFRMEHTFSKDRILELYLNEIYLGSGSYGVAAAALNYFNKSLDELSIAEAAYLAALPKAPNNYQPDDDREAAVARRNWVIQQMEKNGYITAEQSVNAMSAPLRTRARDPKEVADAAYFAEEVRRELIALYGEEKLYTGGLSVRTTLAPELQAHAETALREGLIAYDREHGWRGPVTRISVQSGWVNALRRVRVPEGMPRGWYLAAVLGTQRDHAIVGFTNGHKAKLPMANMAWARPNRDGQRVGPRPNRPSDVVSVGDVVMVSQATDDNGNRTDSFVLEQMPEVSGGIVAMDPHTGRVLAMQGGFSFQRSQFNRVTQARRQPGSAFKPFVYLSALEAGLTPSTIVLDAPFVIDQGPGLDKWKPANYTQKFYGPTPMRVGIEQSRNLMTVRLAQTVGIDKVAETAEAFGLYEDLPHQLAMSLGAGETTLLRMAAGYGMLVNGGKHIRPTLIDRVQDRRGETIFKHDDRPCPNCNADLWVDQPPPRIPDTRGQVTDPASAYQVVSMLRGVVKRGTGRRMRELGKPVAGKTGTTNESHDTWFVGFTPDLVAGVYVGFDDHSTLGPDSYGSNTAGPIFKDFMAKALEGKPGIPFRTPEGIKLVRMELETGQRAGPGSENVILEAFKKGNGPGDKQVVIDRGTPSGTPSAPAAAAADGTATAPAGGTSNGPDGGTVSQPDPGGQGLTGSSGLY